MSTGSQPALPSRRRVLVLGATLLGAGVVGVAGVVASDSGKGSSPGLLTGTGTSPASAPSAGGSASPSPSRPVMPRQILIAGDSTAAVFSRAEIPRAGWGQALSLFTPDVTVVDEATSGTSSRSFYEQGRMDHLAAQCGKDDLMLVSFGHNDEAADDRHTDPATTYPAYLTRYLDAARAKGGRPVLVTPAERRNFDSKGRIVPTHGDYPDAMRELARREAVPLIDLTAQSTALWEQLGPVRTKHYFLWISPGQWRNFPKGYQDDTHFQVQGAVALARVIARDLVRQQLVTAGTVSNLSRKDFEWQDLAWPSKRPADLVPDTSPSPVS